MKFVVKYLCTIVFILTCTGLHAQDYFKLGCIEQDKAHLDKAIEYYHKKVAQDANFVKAYINLGLCYQDKAEYDSALYNFKKALKLQPGDPAIHMSLGTTYFHQKKYNEALENLEVALRKAPNNANGQFDLGMTRHEMKDYKGAVSAFNAAINLEPKKEKFYYSRALSKDFLRDYKGAMIDCSEAVKLKPDYEKAYFLRAKEENELQLYKNALADLVIVIKINPENTRYYAEKGDIEYHIGWLTGSIADCNKAITLKNDYGNPYYTKALAERDSGLLDSAVADITKANEMFKGRSALVWYESGMIKFYSGTYHEALSDFKTALKVNPGYRFAEYMIAGVKFYMKNDSGALKTVSHILSSDSNTSIGFYLLGRILETHLNQHEAAKKNFEKVIALHNDSLMMAYCYAWLGDASKAEEILNLRIRHFEMAGLRIKNRDAYADLAYIYAVLKDDGKFFKCISTALEQGYPSKNWIEDSPEFDYLRLKPEYKDLKGRYGLKK